jgi:transmembrane sensor
MDQNRIWNLVARKISGEASYEELRELYRLLAKNPDIASSQNFLSELWEFKMQEKHGNSEKAYQKLIYRLKEKGIRLRRGNKKAREIKFPLQERGTRFFKEFFILPNNFTIAWQNFVRGKAF